jgi:hypothetical protein
MYRDRGAADREAARIEKERAKEHGRIFSELVRRRYEEQRYAPEELFGDADHDPHQRPDDAA